MKKVPDLQGLWKGLTFPLSEIQIATPAVLFSVRTAYATPFLILTYMNCYIQYT